jgi:hypothetical protein
VNLENRPAQHNQAAVIDTPSLLVEVRAKLFNLGHFFNLKEDPQRVRTQCLHSAAAASDNQTLYSSLGQGVRKIVQAYLQKRHAATLHCFGLSLHILKSHVSTHRRHTDIALTVAAHMSISTMILMRMVMILNDAGGVKLCPTSDLSFDVNSMLSINHGSWQPSKGCRVHKKLS